MNIWKGNITHKWTHNRIRRTDQNFEYLNLLAKLHGTSAESKTLFIDVKFRLQSKSFSL